MKTCSIENCSKPHMARGYCQKHYFRWRKHGNPHTNLNYKGGGIDSNGYKIIYDNKKRVYEHRYIMSQHIGRPLTRKEIVHHIDGDRLNNNLDNLELTNQSLHIINHLSKTEIKDGLKLCSQCKIWKHPSDFPRDKNNISFGLKPYCKHCANIMHKRWRHSKRPIAL